MSSPQKGLDGSCDVKEEKFVAGQISFHASQWEKVSKDPWLIKAVQGVVIPVVEQPRQEREPRPFRLSDREVKFVQEDLGRLLELQVIEGVQECQGQVISNIFLRPKKDGSFRLILDLTWVNEFVEYEHFKMHSIHTALEMMRKGCWMGSIDLKDAYYSVLVESRSRKLLRFRWGGQLFQFRVLPNGLACAPRYFTKILKPVFAHLREEGAECFPYIDDSFVVADSIDECLRTLNKLGSLLRALGFVVHPEKSVVVPTRQLLFLGFMLDSVEFKIFLTKEKEEKLVRAAGQVLDQVHIRIREVAGLIGLMVAFAQAFNYAEAHIKSLEIDKIRALKDARGDFEATMTVSSQSRKDAGQSRRKSSTSMC